MADRVVEKNSKWPPKINFLKQASEMSISTEIDLLITNMIISSQLDASLLVKVAKNVNIEKNVN